VVFSHCPKGSIQFFSLWCRYPEPRLPARSEDWTPAFHRPPSRDQTQPERPVAVVSRSGGKAAAFIDAPFEFIMAAVADDPERESLNGGVMNGGVLAKHDAGSFKNAQCRTRIANVLLPLGEEDRIEQNKNIGQEEKPAMVASCIAISGLLGASGK
jgi:hypothetical protein